MRRYRRVRDSLERLDKKLSSIPRAGIWLYQVSLGLAFRGACRFDPSCSRYADEALREHGALRGTRLAVARVLRCHPFHPGGFDPVPPEPGACRTPRTPGSMVPGEKSRS